MSKELVRIDATDSALQTMLDQVRRVRNLTVQALNNGAQDGNSQSDIATEVSGIRDSLIGQANQVVQGRPLLGGVTSGSQAYDPASGAYTGVGGANNIPVQPVTGGPSDDPARSGVRNDRELEKSGPRWQEGDAGPHAIGRSALKLRRTRRGGTMVLAAAS